MVATAGAFASRGGSSYRKQDQAGSTTVEAGTLALLLTSGSVEPGITAHWLKAETSCEPISRKRRTSSWAYTERYQVWCVIRKGLCLAFRRSPCCARGDFGSTGGCSSYQFGVVQQSGEQCHSVSGNGTWKEATQTGGFTDTGDSFLQTNSQNQKHNVRNSTV
jgi:hypothetical protein